MHKRSIALLILLCTANMAAVAQSPPADGDVVMINPKPPKPMVYVKRSANRYVGLDGKGKSTSVWFVCRSNANVPNQKYYSESFLSSFGCVAHESENDD